MSDLVKQVIADLKNGDPVNHPAHYQGAVECIDAIAVAVEDLQGMDAVLTGNAIKYLWRWRKKGKPLEDLKKARWYLDALIERVESERTAAGTKDY